MAHHDLAHARTPIESLPHWLPEPHPLGPPPVIERSLRIVRPPTTPSDLDSGDAPGSGDEAEPHIRRLAVAIVEAMERRRPLGQLAAWASYAVLADVREWTSRSPAGWNVVSLRIQRPHPGAREVALRLAARATGRCAAVAMRVEQHRGRWVCTAWESVAPAA